MCAISSLTDDLPKYVVSGTTFTSEKRVRLDVTANSARRPTRTKLRRDGDPSGSDEQIQVDLLVVEEELPKRTAPKVNH